MNFVCAWRTLVLAADVADNANLQLHFIHFCEIPSFFEHIGISKHI